MPESKLGGTASGRFCAARWAVIVAWVTCDEPENRAVFHRLSCATLPCMSDVKMAPLTVRVMPSLRQRFKLVCVRQERTMNDVLVEFIAWYTERKEQDDGDK